MNIVYDDEWASSSYMDCVEWMRKMLAEINLNGKLERYSAYACVVNAFSDELHCARVKQNYEYTNTGWRVVGAYINKFVQIHI